MKDQEEHPRADRGYAYVHSSEVIGGRVENADCDAVYISVGNRRFVVYLNGQDKPFVEYGK